MADTIREFLVGLGFKVDQGGMDRFTSAIEGATLRAKLLGDAIEAMAVRVLDAIGRTASGFEQLYYQSQRLGASASSITAFQFAVQQMGGSASAAGAVMESFGSKMRNLPNFEGYLKGIGVKTRDAKGNLLDEADLLFNAVDRLKKMSYPMATRVAEQSLGIDEITLRALEQPGAREEYRKRLASAQSSGMDKNTGPMAAFERAVRETWGRIEDFASGMEAKLGDHLTAPLRALSDYLDTHKDEINGALDKIVAALGGLADKAVKALGSVKWEEIGDEIANKVVPAFVDLAKALGEIASLIKDLLKGLDPLLKLLQWANPGAGTTPTNEFGLPIDPNTGETTLGDKGALGWWRRTMPTWLGGRGGGGKPDFNGGIKGFWTPERMAHAVDRLEKEAGLSHMGAAALVARWTREAPGGPSTVNSIGATGINQALGTRRPAGYEKMSFEQQLDYIIKNDIMSPDQRKALMTLRSASTPLQGSIGASQYERAEYYNGTTDVLTYGTPVETVLRAIGGVKTAPAANKTIGQPPAGWANAPNAWAGIDSALPVGSGASAAAGDKTVHSTVNNNIHIVAPDPHTAGAAVGVNLDRSSADLTRNLQTAIQ